MNGDKGVGCMATSRGCWIALWPAWRRTSALRQRPRAPAPVAAAREMRAARRRDNPRFVFCSGRLRGLSLLLKAAIMGVVEG